MEVIGGVSGVITVISGVAKLSKNLNEIRDRYRVVALNTALVASQLSTIRAALEAIADWRRTADSTSPYSKQLDEDLAVSLNCCAILVTVLNSKLVESGFKPGMKSKIKYLWLEDVLKEYLSNLEGQVRALQLLLTVFQCRTATEQSRRLERAESRTVIENLRAETASLQPDGREPQDAASIRSIDVSVDFDVDSMLLKHRTYKKVYSNYHVHRHQSASQVVSDNDSVGPVIDHSERSALNTADETHGWQYQRRLRGIATAILTDDEEIGAFQIPNDGPQLSLKRVAERASLPVVDHSEASLSNRGNIEVPWTQPTVVQAVNNRLDQSTHRDYYEGLATSNSGLDLATVNDISSHHRPGISQSGLQTQSLFEPAGKKSSEDSRLLSLINPANDTACPTLSARADSPTIRAPDSRLKTRTMLPREDPTSSSPVKTSSINNHFTHTDSALETATSTSCNFHCSLASIKISRENEVVSPRAWTKPSLNEHLPKVADSLTSLPEARISGKQGRVPSTSDAPMNSSPSSSATPPIGSSIAVLNQSLLQPSFTSKPPNDASYLSSVGDVVSERQQIQAELSRLQHEFTAAKTRGDGHSAQAYLQKLMKLIEETYLARETCMEVKPSLVRTKLIPRRNHKFRLPSLAPLSQMPTRARASRNTAAVEAACSGNYTKLKELLEQGINVNARSGDSKTLFIHAATYGHIDCMELLKRRGADELAVDYKGLNALHSAVLARQNPVVEWLLKSYPSTEDRLMHLKPSKANKSQGRSNPHNPLREASSREGFTPIHLAAKHGQVDVLNMLVEHGADIEAKCDRGGTPLHHAVISSYAHVVSAILSKGADLMTADASGLTPLHHAATSGDVAVINALLTAGCERSAYDNKGNMPIHLAAGNGWIAAVKALRRDLADLEVKTDSGESLLHIAVRMNQPQIVEYLLQHKVHVNTWSKSPPAKLERGKIVSENTMRHDRSSTPLHSACFAGQYEISASLLEHEAWPNAATADGKTPLMLAVESDDTDLVNLLLTRNAKVDAKIPRSFLTAQHIAAQMGNLEILQVLYQHGASLDALTSDSKYPADHVYLCKDLTKRAAVLNWFREIRLKKSAHAREINALKRQRTVEQNQQQHKPTTPETPHGDPMTLIRQLSPAYHGFDQEYDTFPEAPPPYVAGPLALPRLAK